MLASSERQWEAGREGCPPLWGTLCYLLGALSILQTTRSLMTITGSVGITIIVQSSRILSCLTIVLLKNWDSNPNYDHKLRITCTSLNLVINFCDQFHFYRIQKYRLCNWRIQNKFACNVCTHQFGLNILLGGGERIKYLVIIYNVFCLSFGNFSEQLEWIVELCGASLVKQPHLFTHATVSLITVWASFRKEDTNKQHFPPSLYFFQNFW